MKKLNLIMIILLSVVLLLNTIEYINGGEPSWAVTFAALIALIITSIRLYLLDE